jgi:hypothetical protein
MAYVREFFSNSVINTNATTATTAISLTQSPAAVVATYIPMMPVVLQKVFFNVSTTVFNLTGAVVTCNLVTGVTNATPVTAAICTLTIPLATTAAGTTVGTTLVNNAFTPTLVPVGSKISFSLAPGVQGGTAAGAGFLGWYGTYSPEEMTNETKQTVTIVTV